jgi:hypothetical protein
MTDPTCSETLAAPHPHLTEPLADLAAWTHYFRETEIPVLAVTSQAIEELRAIEDDVDAGMLNAVIQTDPLMTLKLMAFISGRRRPEAATDIESITSSLVMMGVSPFFNNFGLQPTVEDWLSDEPQALAGLRALLERAERAGRFAVGFAVHRNDMDAGAIHMAAFLHDFAEMLLWCHAPRLALKIFEAQRADSTLRSAVIQRRVLGIELDDLRQALMELCRLPELLVHISDARYADQVRVRNVILAVRLARHTMDGWDNAALPDDVNDIAELLNAPPRIALAFLHKIDES